MRGRCCYERCGGVDREGTLIKKEEYHEAARVLEQAFEETGRSRKDIHERMQRVQRLIKQSKQKDYYKVLGVDRDTDVRTIKKGLYVSPIIIYHAFHSRRASKIAHRAKIAAVNEAPTKFSTIPSCTSASTTGKTRTTMAAQGEHPFFANGQHPFAQFFQQGITGSSISTGVIGRWKGFRIC
ncbi:hypothetical protein L208DRAFT_839908 [Tricholoma matsutake]|nr:hypothetical protein L208DRAFT_839908 [Tricholoma matsutake 945]